MRVEFDCGKHYVDCDDEFIGGRKLSSTKCPQCQMGFVKYVDFGPSPNISNSEEK